MIYVNKPLIENLKNGDVTGTFGVHKCFWLWFLSLNMVEKENYFEKTALNDIKACCKIRYMKNGE